MRNHGKQIQQPKTCKGELITDLMKQSIFCWQAEIAKGMEVQLCPQRIDGCLSAYLIGGLVGNESTKAFWSCYSLKLVVL